LKQILDKILDNSGVLAGIAVVLGVGAMALMFLIFDNSFDEARPGSEVVSELAGGGSDGLAEGEVFPLYIRSIPAPFVSPEDGSVLGYVFLDVTLEVAGSEARQRAEAALDGLIMDFTERVNEGGVGMPSRPGVVDYDRLAGLFMELAQAEVGVSGIARVVIQASQEN
jgi:hypothetical protein